MRFPSTTLAGACSVIAMLFATTACSGPDIYEADDILHGTGDIEVEVHSYIEEDLEVDDVIGRNKRGRVTSQFVLTNDEKEPMRLRITWSWRDADGMQLRAASGPKPEQEIVLRSDESRTFTFTSPSSLALKFTAEIHHNTARR